ncbi:MAG: hypothetical protein ACREA9_21870 [Pyrinomonadaceae bacterium]
MAKKTSPLQALENLPQTSDAHELADYIELLCLVTEDGRISKADVIAWVKRRVKDLSEGKPSEIEEIEDETLLEDQGLEEAGGEPPAINDKWDERGIDWFRHLEYRVGAFGEYYPFKMLKSGSVLVLKRPKSSVTLKHKLYLFFLLASNLRLFSKADVSSIASIFEFISYCALEAYLPANTELHMFGKHPLNTGRYSRSLWRKLDLLAKDIREKVVCAKADFKPTNSGDAGLDLVGWSALEDKSAMTRGFLLAFGQCACTKAWVKKQHETHYDEWKNYMSFTSYPFRLTFIPYCFRTASGDWYEWTKIHMTVLIDRGRLLRLLTGKQNRLKTHINLHVDDVLNNAEPVM